MRYLVGTQDLGLQYPKDTSFDLVGYSDTNFAGSRVDRNSTSSTCQFLKNALVSQFSKKQNCVVLSIYEAEYIAQLLWIKQQFKDYGINLNEILLKYDNSSTINLSKNPIIHSRSKHIKVRHHFLRDHVQNKHINIEFISTDDQLANIFTKPLREERFYDLRSKLGIYDLYI